MPTRLIFKEKHVTPEELLETIKLHFDTMPSDQLYLASLTFTACDKYKNEMVIYNNERNEIAENLFVSPKSKVYSKSLSIKTIIRDKAKAN